MIVRCILVCLIILLSLLNSRAQQEVYTPYIYEKSQVSFKTVPKNEVFIQSDNAIVPGTIQIKGNTNSVISDSTYVFDWQTSIIKFLKLPKEDSLTISYRVFPFTFAQTFQKKEKKIFNPFDDDVFLYDPSLLSLGSTKGDDNIFNISGLNYNGVFSRGVIVGSNRDLVLNSALDINIAGKISKDWGISAYITDNNIPIQPEGNTARIQQFDKVYIKLNKNEEHNITAGDYDLSDKGGYFMKYFRQMQGAAYKGNYQHKDKLSSSTNAAFAISKGKFSRNQFNGGENKQGPYRLKGNNNESFIIIIAGTERVFVNGKKLKRGIQNDYIMDYNSGDITFTPTFLITKDDRIVVEFEYAEENYFRTITYGSEEIKTKKASVLFQAFLEQDSKNRPIQFDITDERKKQLSELDEGNEIILVPSPQVAPFDVDRVQYKLKDTLVNGMMIDTVYEVSKDKNETLYNVRFAFLGKGNGNYEVANSPINGRIYEFKPPINGIKQGSYDPLEILIAPKRSHLYTLGGTYNPNEKMSFTYEGALSIKDNNTFSSLDNDNNIGMGTYVKGVRNDKIGKTNPWELRTSIAHEWKQKNFKELERYRAVEFNRNWNQSNLSESTDEHLAYAEIQAQNNKGATLGYQLTTLQKRNSFRGYENKVTLKYKKDNLSFDASIPMLFSKGEDNNTRFFRPTVEAIYGPKKFTSWVVGVRGEHEFNKIMFNASDSLNKLSFANLTLRTYLNSPQDKAIEGKIEYIRRTDWLPQTTDFETVSQGNTVKTSIRLKPIKGNSLQWFFTFRNLSVLDSALVPEPAGNTVLNRIQYNYSLPKGNVRLESNYEISSLQEPLREYVFIRVPNGQGVFAWIDQNNDGIQQQNEFISTGYLDSAKYVRVLNNFRDFIRADEVSLNVSLYAETPREWRTGTGIKKILSKFTIQSSMETRRKTQKGDNLKPFNPFSNVNNQENILFENSFYRNTLYFNRADPKYTLTYTSSINRNKTLLVNGLDSRQYAQNNFSARWSISKNLTLSPSFVYNKDLYNSQFFPENNYNIREVGMENKISILISQRTRLQINHTYKDKQNGGEFGGEKATIHLLGIVYRWNKVGSFSINPEFNYVRNIFKGESTNSIKAFNLLEGLQPGNNYLWKVELEKMLSNNFILSIRYDGRKAGSNKMIHTGQAQIRALF